MVREFPLYVAPGKLTGKFVLSLFALNNTDAELKNKFVIYKGTDFKKRSFKFKFNFMF